jgi:hypothetical protein
MYARLALSLHRHRVGAADARHARPAALRRAVCAGAASAIVAAAGAAGCAAIVRWGDARCEQAVRMVVVYGTYAARYSVCAEDYEAWVMPAVLR